MFSTDVLSTNPELPAQADPADIRLNSEEAILSRIQITVNKWILQVSGEFESNPGCRSNPWQLGLALPSLCLVPHGTAEWHQDQKKNHRSRPRHGTSTHVGAGGAKITFTEPLCHHGCRRARTAPIGTTAAYTSVSAASASIHGLGKIQETPNLRFYGLSEQRWIWKHF